MFIYFWGTQRERQSVTQQGAEGEGDSESEAGYRLWVVSTEPDPRLKLMNHEIMTKAICFTDWATQVPLYHNYFKKEEREEKKQSRGRDRAEGQNK